MLLGRLKVLILGESPCVGIAGWEEEGWVGVLLAGGEIVGDECKAARFGVDRPRLHLAPSPTVHSDKEDSLFCSFVALKIIILLWHIGMYIV